MSKTAWYRVGRSLIVAGAVTVLAGCTGEGSLGPDGRAATGAQLAASEVSLVPDLGTCGHLKVDAGHEFALRLFASTSSRMSSSVRCSSRSNLSFIGHNLLPF